MASGKTLIVAEKPSVAADIAKALGVSRTNGTFENDEVVISNCRGHLVEIFSPLAESYGTPLPIIPEKFMLRTTPGTAEQFKVVKSLMMRPDIAVVANACDAGREGEAIFRLVYEHAGCKKPMERMWLQSMTNAAIKTAWKDRKPGSHYNNLADASRCRAEADWEVGINGSRAARKAVGRVMTPTLALVYDRFVANRDFVPKDYFEIHGKFMAQAGEYKGRWLATGASAEGDEDSGSRITDKAKAQSIVDKCKGVAPSSVTDNTKPTRSAPPFLYDLTTLQREANKRFKLSAKKTLEIAQNLYEKHKATSYPRTDASALPEDYVPKAASIVKEIGAIAAYAPHADRITSNNWVKPSKRIFNDAKISDHFAIIPTGVIPHDLAPDEQKIYDMVCRRFLAIFHPDAEYLSTTRTTIVAGESFRSSGRVLKSSGWLDVYGGKGADEDKTPSLALVAPGEQVKNVAITLESLKTKAPALYTEATLLSAMESAGKALDDEDLADAMKERGLGTPATRAATIEKLLVASKTKAGTPIEPYMNREGKEQYLVPSARGIDIIEYLRKACPSLTSPVLTGEWEFKLHLMEKGKHPRAEFMAGIAGFVTEMVKTVQRPGGAGGVDNSPDQPLPGICPSCKKESLQINGRKCSCLGCSFELWRTIAGKQLSLKQMSDLLRDGELPLMDGFLSKTKKPFSAGLKFNQETAKVEFVFPPREAGAPAQQSADKKAVSTPCPKCKGELTADEKTCACTCGFRLWREVAKRKIKDNEMLALLKDGRTSQLSGFVGRKGTFKAVLKLAEDLSGEVEFVFH